MTIPAIGPIMSSAVVAAIGNGTAFTRGHDFAGVSFQSIPAEGSRV